MFKRLMAISGLIVALALVTFICQTFLYGQYYTFKKANVYWSNAGVFSTNNRIQSWGENNTLRLAYTDAVYKDFACDSNGVITVDFAAMSSGDSSKLLYLTGTPTATTAGIRQGLLQIIMDRTSGYAMTASDGNPDCGVKIQVKNRTASEDYWRGRGIDLLVEERDTSGAYWMEGIYAAVKNRSGTTMNDAGYMTAIKAETNHNATGTCEVIGININDITQSSTASALYGIKITTGNYAITRTYGLYISATNGSWTNGISFFDTITNAFDFENTDGTNAAGYNAGYTNPAAYAVPDGYIKVDIGGNTQYIYTWTTIPS